MSQKQTRAEYQRLLNALDLANREVANSLDRPERLAYWLNEYKDIQWKLYEFHCNYSVEAVIDGIPAGYAEQVIAEWEGVLDGST